MARRLPRQGACLSGLAPMLVRRIRHGQSPRHLAGMVRQRRFGISSSSAETGRAFSPRRTVPDTRQLGSGVVATYGAALRRSLEAAAKRLRLHAAVAFAPGLRLTIGQFRVHDRSNALTAMPGLLDFGRPGDGCTRLSDETRACSTIKQQTRKLRRKNRTGSYFFLCSDDSGMHVATWGRTKSRSDHRIDCRLPVGSRAMHDSRQLGLSSGAGCESRARCRLNQVFTDA